MSNSQPSISGRAPSVASGRTARSARSARSTNQPRGQFNRRTGNGSAGGSFPSLTLARRKGGDDDDEEDEMVLALKRLVEQRDEEVERLNQQLDSEQRRVAMLESELGLSLAASSRAESAHAAELAKVEADVARVLAERRGLLEKLTSIEVVEDAVRDLVVQMKARVGDDQAPSPAQLQAEKEALRSENILVVLGSLHAILKNLWSFKVEAEEDLRITRNNRTAAHTSQVLALRGQLREMEAQLAQAQAAEEQAKQDAAEEAFVREAVVADNQAALAEMEAKHREVLGALKSSLDESMSAQRALGRALEEGRKRDTLVLRNQQLESARHFDRVAQDKELRRMHSEHNKQLASMQRELSRISDLMLQNDTMRQRIHQLESKCEQLRVQAVAASSALQNVQRLGSSFGGSVLNFPAGPMGQSVALSHSASMTHAGLTGPSRPAGLHMPATSAATAGGGSISTSPRHGGSSRPMSAVGLGPGTASIAGSSSNAGQLGSGPGRPGTAAASSCGGGGGAGGGGSPAMRAMSDRARALMASIRAERQAAERVEAEAKEEADPIYQTLTNVNKLHKATKAAIKEVKLDVHEPPEVQRGKLGPHGHVAPSIVAGLKSAFN